MWYTNIYINIIVYQKYIGTSIKIGCATHSMYASSGLKAEGVPTNNQRGRGSGSCCLWGGLDKARHIVPTASLVRVQRLRNDLYKDVKGPSTRPIVLSICLGDNGNYRMIAFYCYVLCIGILLSWHANDVMFWGAKPILGRKRITLPEPKAFNYFRARLDEIRFAFDPP